MNAIDNAQGSSVSPRERWWMRLYRWFEWDQKKRAAAHRAELAELDKKKPDWHWREW